MAVSCESEHLKISLHRVGNKSLDEGISLADKLLTTSTDLNELLASYFLSPFKSEEYYNFYHESELNLNETYVYVSKIFQNPENLYEESVRLAKHLYEKSTHPNIKAGEFYVAYFEECSFNGENIDAIGLFKSENKDTFLKVMPWQGGFNIESEHGININKLDKGCLIFNTEAENGYVVAVVDNTNKGAEAQYWMDNFLHLRQRKDEYYKTQNVLNLCKTFVTKELPRQFEVSKADQVDLLNKSVKYFKENEDFNIGEFAQEVMGAPEVVDHFKEYRRSYANENDIEFDDSFGISGSAVKKQARIFKSVIKLDKNFHIYVHGNRELIEQGTDEKGKYYKVYFKEEH